ncbi:hypothetical protein XENOCAPTIV_012548, partial [Xenoophorus captivus]
GGSDQMTYLPLVVSGYSSHIVVHCGQDRDGLFSDVDSSEDHGRLRDSRQPCGQLLRRQVVELQVHVILLRTHTSKEIRKDTLSNFDSKMPTVTEQNLVCVHTCPP